MIQCSLIVFDAYKHQGEGVFIGEKSIDEYTSFVKPIYTKELSDYIKELTGIKQEDVDRGCNFTEAISCLSRLISKHSIKKIFVWGPDWLLLKQNCELSGCNMKLARRVLNKMHDVSGEISSFFEFERIVSQHSLCDLLKIQECGSIHDSYCDAYNLSQVIRKFCVDNPHQQIINL